MLVAIFGFGPVAAETADCKPTGKSGTGEGLSLAVERDINSIHIILEFNFVPFTFHGVKIGFEFLFAFLVVTGRLAAIEIKHQPVIFGTQTESGNIMFGMNKIDLIIIHIQRHKLKLHRITCPLREK